MTDLIADGRLIAFFTPTIASTTLAPTVAELTTTGHRISRWLVPTGLAGFEQQQAEVDNTGIEQDNDSKLPGQKTNSGTSITLKEQEAGSVTAYDAAVTAMAEYTDGFIVIRHRLLSTVAPAVGQKVFVYTVRCGTYEITGFNERNTTLKRMIMTPISGRVVKDVAILA